MKKGILPAFIALSFITIVIILPIAVFAMPAEGDRCTTDYVNTLVGSDGDYYYRTGVQTSIKYLKDGTTEAFSHENYDGPRRHYLIMPDGQNNYYGYCIEQGVSFPDANRYTGIGWNNDPYLNSLPETAKNGILMSTIYGRQPNKEVPVSGCNEDDWYWATQVIIWEYQQQLRLSPTKIQSNGYVSANYFQSTLDGRPAEKCYNYILSAIANHEKTPSFAAVNSGDASVNVLKWIQEKSLWSLTLHDTNQIRLPLRFENSNLQLSRTGDDYTFVAKNKITGLTLAFKKDIDLPSHDMLVWGSATGSQTIVTGTADPLEFYIRFRTEQPGILEILKTSEDGVKEGFMFHLTDPNGKKTGYTTNQKGGINISLFPGAYRVSEAEPGRYRHPQDFNVQIKENNTTTLQIENILKKGRIRIEKTVKDEISGQSYIESNSKFQIFPVGFQDFETSPSNLKQEITTDKQGIATSKELPLGQYRLHQISAGKNIAYSIDRKIDIREDFQTIALPIENVMQKGKIEIFKTDKQNNPLPSAVFTIRAAEDIYGFEESPKHRVGDLIETLITGPDGLASTDWLYPGMYSLEEIMAPKGFYPPENPITTIHLVPENKYEAAFAMQVVVQNEPVEHVPNTGELKNDKEKEILLSLMLIGLNGLLLAAFVSKERNNKLR